jgi:Ca2+-binding EF-hand superfamily protein
MTGQLQREKAAYYFSIIDEDNNKYIEADDFELRAERLVEARGVTDPDAKAEIHDQVMNWWHHLCSVADVDDDGQITQREWQRYWEGLQAAVEEGGEANEAVLEGLERAARATFHSMKVNDGDQVTQDEYAEWLAAWGVDDAEAPFDRLDRDDTGGLTEENLVQAVREFYLSNDPDAPGNVLYGELPE